MPRLNAEEKEEMAAMVEEILVSLDELYNFSEENGPKGLTRKFQRAIYIMDDVQEQLVNVISVPGSRRKKR